MLKLIFLEIFTKSIKKKINKQNYKIATYQIIRDSIDMMIKDLISNTKKNLSYNNIKKLKDIYNTDFLIVNFSKKVKVSENEIKFFLKTKMYNNRRVLEKNNKGKSIIKKLFVKIKQQPTRFISKEQLSNDKYRAISDFISGMTDRYAINLYNDNK